MLIPHSESRIFNFRVTAVALIVVGVLAFGIISAFFYASTVYSSRNQELSRRSEELNEMEEGLERVHQSVAGLRGGAAEFQRGLAPALEQFNLEPDDSSAVSDEMGDFSTLQEFSDVSDEEMLENLYVNSVSGMLEDVMEPLEQLASRIEQERDFLNQLPVLWPLEGGRGRVRNSWGPSMDPVTGDFSMNQGLIVWDVPGSPVVSSAHGRVSRVDFDADEYGWYIDVEHGFGFKTRYSHLQQVRVRSGDSISQGQTIGTLGSTGGAVEPQLGFEIWLGTENVDPDSFLMIRSALSDFIAGDVPADLNDR